MDLRLYNTKTRRKETFRPRDPANVGMYVCGPTVYDRAHVGNARPVLVFDVLARLLRRIYGKGHVTYVRNITDVDDKIINAARENGEPIAALTERTTAAFHADMKALGALDPDVEPRATGTIPEMVKLIEALIGRGHAYVVQRHVLFSTRSYKRYGRLSRRRLREMIDGARVEVAPYKKHPADFVLWKPSTHDQPGWSSPWGLGRPGWHIECSAMSEKYLGQDFDIHGGGIDLIFPHHENEIAQSVCAHDGAGFARLWMHNGFVTVDGEKMSKSLGNFRTVHEVLDAGHRGETIRYFMLQTHYRKPLDWREKGLQSAEQSLTYLYKSLWLAMDNGVEISNAQNEEISYSNNLHQSIEKYLLNDLNTSTYLMRLSDFAGGINRSIQNKSKAFLRMYAERLVIAGRFLGFLQEDPDLWLKGLSSVGASVDLRWIIDGKVITEQWINEKIAERSKARRHRDFGTADSIRKELLKLQILLEDLSDGRTIWRRVT